MADRTETEREPATIGDVAMLFVGAVMFLGLSLLPPLLGPLCAPRALNVIAPAVCPGEPTRARTEIVVSRSRNKTTYTWNFRCAYADGRVERLSNTRSTLAAWLLFNGAIVLSLLAATKIYNALRRHVWGAKS